MKAFVKKYFIPNQDNEYVPHMMRKASIGVFSFLAILVFFFGIVHVVIIQETSLLGAVIPKTLVELANNNRASNRVSFLTTNPLLESAAQKKANDMASKGYFAHTSPEGKTPWYWFNEVGYDFQYAGENLAVNFVDSIDVDSAWMNSPGHRSNILNGKFTEIGIATAKGMYNGRETIFVVQMFGKPLRSNAVKRLVGGANSPVAIEAKIGTGTPATTNIPKSASQGSALKVASTSSTTPTQAIRPPRVLGETEMFTEIAVAEENQFTDVRRGEELSRPNMLEELLASPKKVTGLLFGLLLSIALLALVLMVVIEVRKQHPHHIALGIFLIVFIVFLSYIFRAVLFPEVLVV